MTGSNNPPRLTWTSYAQSNGSVRHRLYVDGREHAYFVDDDRKAGQGHHAMGCPVSLHGSGMGGEVRCRDGSSYRTARMLYGCNTVREAKARAENMVLSA